MKKKLSFIVYCLLLTTCLNAGLLEDNLKKLHSDNATIRRLSARALGSLHDKRAVPEMLGALKKEKNESVKIALIDSLGILKSGEAVPLLLEKSKKGDEQVRTRSIAALGEIGDKNAVPGLKKLLKDKSPVIKCYAAGVLRKMGVKDGLKVILDVLNKEPGAKMAAVKNLGEFKGGKPVAVLTPFLKDKEASLRKETAIALGKIRNKKAVPALIERLNDENLLVKLMVIRAIGDIEYKIAATPLEEILKSEKNKTILKETISALGKIGQKSSADIIYPFLKDKNKAVAGESIQALANLKNNSGSPYLIKCFNDEDMPKWLRGKSIDSARKKGDEKTRKKAVKTLLAAKKWSVLWKDEEAPLLSEFTADKSRTIRARAYSGLAGINMEKYWQTIVPGLEDKSAVVKKAIISKIGKFKFQKGLKKLKENFAGEKKDIKEDILKVFYDSADRQGLKMGLNDTDLYIRVMAASGLGDLGDNSGFDIAVKGLKSRDDDIRDTSIEALENMKDKRAVVPLKKFRKTVKDKELRQRLKELIKKIKRNK